MQAIPLLKDSIKKAYGKKGDKVVNMNYAAVDKAMERLVKIEIPAGWGREEVSQGEGWVSHGPAGIGNAFIWQWVKIETTAWDSCHTSCRESRNFAPMAPGKCTCPAVVPEMQRISVFEIRVPEFLQIPARVGGAEALASQTGSRTPQEFLERVVKPMLNMEGDRLPVR